MRRGHTFGASDCHVTLNTQGEWWDCWFCFNTKQCYLMVSLNGRGTPVYFWLSPYPSYFGWHCTAFLVNTTPKCQWFFLKIKEKKNPKRRPIGVASCTTDQDGNNKKVRPSFSGIGGTSVSLLSLVLHQLQTWWAPSPSPSVPASNHLPSLLMCMKWLSEYDKRRMEPEPCGSRL